MHNESTTAKEAIQDIATERFVLFINLTSTGSSVSSICPAKTEPGAAVLLQGICQSGIDNKTRVFLVSEPIMTDPLSRPDCSSVNLMAPTRQSDSMAK